MTQKINEKQLEQIVTEAATLALERLSFIAESKGKKTMTDKKINEAVKESLKMVLKEMKVSQNPKKSNMSQLKNEIPLTKQNIERRKKNILDMVGITGLNIKAMSNGDIIFYIKDSEIGENSVENIRQQIENNGISVINQRKGLGNMYIFKIDSESKDIVKQLSYYAKLLNTLIERKRHLEMSKMSSKERDDFQ